MLALADPVYPTAGDKVGPRLRSAISRGALGALPATRFEAEAIASSFGDRARVYTGADAHEDRVREISGSLRALHFACHGLIDHHFPLESGLALSAGDDDDGLLQAWEIMEDIRVDVDLVTLSACETALGRESDSEGLVGLVSAWEYAGARAVLASLWPVADEATATLMADFYRELAAGARRDDALRHAQVQQIKSGETPFHWAGFVLDGP